MSRPLYTREIHSKEYRELGGTQSQSEWMWITENFFSPIGVQNPNLPTCSKSLHRLHYPSSAKIVPRTHLLDFKNNDFK